MDLTPEALEEGKQYITEDRIDIRLKDGKCDKLYIEVIASAGEREETAIIAGSHTHFVSGDASYARTASTDGDDEIALNLRLVYDFEPARR